MIKNFEQYTCELNYEELHFIMPRLFKILTLAIGKENAITNKFIVNNINRWEQITYALPDDKMGVVRTVKTSEPRIRHMIHILRVSDTLPCLIATSHGYYISNDKEEVLSYIQSIDDRLRSIYQVRRAMKRQLKEWVKPNAIQFELNFN